MTENVDFSPTFDHPNVADPCSIMADTLKGLAEARPRPVPLDADSEK